MVPPQPLPWRAGTGDAPVRIATTLFRRLRPIFYRWRNPP